MTRTENCRMCGAQVPRDAPEGYCPRCLAGLAAGVAPNLIGQPPEQPHDGNQRIRYFGDYELTAEIASGGMGVVYRARQISLNRSVALKMIRAGQFATVAEVQRFRTEAEAAANLDHLNIVPIYEVGEHEGRHYFSMKLVEGGNLAQLNAECGVRNAAWLRRMAVLVARIACAVHHAHQRGVLHRDLKPTNILLDEHGEPHLTDFGLAKLADRGKDLTQTLAVLGTPHYMSPEQAAGHAREVTTAADIYSLGAILYELLTGRPPFKGDSALEVLEQARQREADSPRKLNPSVDRDLETICRKCLEKEPARRYDTAEALAEDLDHWLAREPIQARATTAVERVIKWGRRNPALASLIVLAHVLFLAGIIGVLWQWQRAEGEAERATANAKTATFEAARSAQVAQFMKDMLEGVGPSVALGRDTTLLREILDQTAERVGRDLKEQPLVEAELRSTLGGIYLRIAQYEKAETMHREALRLRESAFTETNELIAASLNDLARVLINNGQPRDLPEAEEKLSSALEMRRNLLGNDHPDVALTLYLLASALQREGRLDQAERLHQEALTIRRKILGSAHPDIASSLNNLARVYTSQGRYSEAEAALNEALVMQRTLLGGEHPDVADSLDNLGEILLASGKLAEAETATREALALRRKLLGDSHPRTQASRNRLMSLLVAQKKNDEAEPVLREELASARKLHGNNSRTVDDLLVQLADCLVAKGRFTEALEFRREELAVEKHLSGDEHPWVANSLMGLGELLMRMGELEQAESVFREALAIRRKLVGANTSETASTLSWLAAVVREQERLSEAEILARECIQIRRSLFGNNHPTVLSSLNGLALILQRQNRSSEWETVAREALAVARTIHTEDHLNVASALDQLADALQARDEFVESASNFREALAMQRRLLGDGHDAVAGTLAKFTMSLLRAGKFSDAEPSARECLGIREKTLPNHWLKFNAQSQLGGCLLGQKRYAEAEPLLLSGYEGMKQREGEIPPAGKPRVKETLDRLVQLYEATGQSEKADEYKRRRGEFNAADVN